MKCGEMFRRFDTQMAGKESWDLRMYVNVYSFYSCLSGKLV